jgi:transcriptional regulator with XRE-family HTH domain
MGATVMEQFGKRLKQLREAAGLTQEGLARAAGLSTSAVARIEQRGKDPAWSTVQRLARALGVALSAFETEEEGEPTRQGRPTKSASSKGRKGRRTAGEKGA